MSQNNSEQKSWWDTLRDKSKGYIQSITKKSPSHTHFPSINSESFSDEENLLQPQKSAASIFSKVASFFGKSAPPQLKLSQPQNENAFIEEDPALRTIFESKPDSPNEKPELFDKQSPKNGIYGDYPNLKNGGLFGNFENSQKLEKANNSSTAENNLFGSGESFGNLANLEEKGQRQKIEGKRQSTPLEEDKADTKLFKSNLGSFSESKSAARNPNLEFTPRIADQKLTKSVENLFGSVPNFVLTFSENDLTRSFLRNEPSLAAAESIGIDGETTGQKEDVIFNLIDEDSNIPASSKALISHVVDENKLLRHENKMLKNNLFRSHLLDEEFNNLSSELDTKASVSLSSEEYQNIKKKSKKRKKTGVKTASKKSANSEEPPQKPKKIRKKDKNGPKSTKKENFFSLSFDVSSSSSSSSEDEKTAESESAESEESERKPAAEAKRKRGKFKFVGERRSDKKAPKVEVEPKEKPRAKRKIDSKDSLFPGSGETKRQAEEPKTEKAEKIETIEKTQISSKSSLFDEIKPVTFTEPKGEQPAATKETELLFASKLPKKSIENESEKTKENEFKTLFSAPSNAKTVSFGVSEETSKFPEQPTAKADSINSVFGFDTKKAELSKDHMSDESEKSQSGFETGIFNKFKQPTDSSLPKFIDTPKNTENTVFGQIDSTPSNMFSPFGSQSIPSNPPDQSKFLFGSDAPNAQNSLFPTTQNEPPNTPKQPAFSFGDTNKNEQSDKTKPFGSFSFGKDESSSKSMFDAPFGANPPPQQQSGSNIFGPMGGSSNVFNSGAASTDKAGMFGASNSSSMFGSTEPTSTFQPNMPTVSQDQMSQVFSNTGDSENNRNRRIFRGRRRLPRG